MKVSVIFGTRPEAIKLAPVILALKSTPGIRCQVCVTAQHRQMLDQALRLFGISPDSDLDLMRPSQSLADLTSSLIQGLDAYLSAHHPDLVLVQGDTTTVFCAALAAFYHRVPVGHVEAGLRTWDLEAPWPEEANRVLTTRLAALHFAPTEKARDNLLREGVPAERIFVTGNTVIDALLWVSRRIAAWGHESLERAVEVGITPGFAEKFLNGGAVLGGGPRTTPRLILVTGHRRESFGKGFENICEAVRRLVERYEHVGVVYPVHLNPNVQQTVQRALRGHERIQLIPPVSYEHFVWLMSKCYIILSDSGGVQEEAPTLGKPVLVLRETTERPEGVEAGTCRLVGTEPGRILREAAVLLEDEAEYHRRSLLSNPYGDGAAAARIVKECLGFLRARGIRPRSRRLTCTVGQ